MAALAGVLGAGSTVISNYFDINKISVDNWTFKLYYKYSTMMFIFIAMIVNYQQFFGAPILCDAGHAAAGINPVALDTYCWMFSTFHVGGTYSGQCSAIKGELEVGLDEPQLVYNSYYQWIPLYLFVTAVVFHIPRMVWLYFEGGLMKYFSKGATGRDIPEKDAKKEKLLEYFRNCVSHKYLTYGWDYLIYHTSLSPGEQSASWNPNPGCATFPRMASCNYYRYGPAGAQEKINVLCVLALNIINDKVFAVIWLWVACLAMLSFSMLIYRLVVSSSSYLRLQILNMRVGRTDIRKKERIIRYLNERPLGDWFVLYQMSKNLRRAFFMEFLTDLSNMYCETPTESEGDTVVTMLMKPSVPDHEEHVD